MAERTPSGGPQRLPVTLAAGAVLVGGLVAAIIAVDRANGSPAQPSATTPTATARASASPTPSVIPFADCSAQKFGAPLAPLNPPANVHVYSAPPAMTIDTTKLYLATITTPRGAIVICLQPDLAPVTVNNFVTLARNHFYDGLKFHRVVAGFVIQGGDPLGTGSGGPGYKFNDEPVRQHYTAGAVAMANSGPNTNGSQFFICTVDDTTSLKPLYNLFGNVVSGLTVAQQVQQGDVMSTVTVSEQS